jgi:UDP-N-acetylmuramate dehydrogenase
MSEMDNTSLRGKMRHDEPLSRHTTWRVGGPARCFYRPADRMDLLAFLQGIDPDEPILWLGLGSNLLVRDGGFNGTVIATQGRLEAIEWRSKQRLYVEAGVSCAKVARTAARAGLSGVEFLAGIPGTIGGALAMNAGAFGGETWRRVVQVETVDHRGQMHLRQPNEYEVGYRQVRGPAGEWFLATELALDMGDTESSQQAVRKLLEQRAASQPTRQPSCGSVFRNPPGHYAARLIEAAGLKGLSLGGAQVSEKHANFIINTGTAKAADIEGLIELVQQQVEQKTGVCLIPEVRRVGEKA